MKHKAYLYIIPALLTLCAAMATGCSGVKGLKALDLDMPATVVAGSTDSLTVADVGWWQFYTDSTLCNIIERTLENNRDLLRAAARIEEMRQLWGVSKANMLPELSATVGADYETNDYYKKSYTTDPEYDLKVTLGWELNLWGAMTWAKRQGAASYKASVEDWRAMRMTLVAEVASAYFRLIALDNELAIVRRTLITRQEGVEQARIRFEGGLTSETVYQQAKVEYASTASLVPNLERQIAVARNAITLLMGEYPTDKLNRGYLHLDAAMPQHLPAGLSSTLLQRRPDLRAGEQRLAAAMANVGLTYADRFPRLRIAVTGGFENDELSGLLQSPFSYTVGSIAGSIFDFGRKKRKYQASVAAYDQARLAYEQSVLTAFQEVNDAIVTYRRVQETAVLKTNLRDAARKYVDLAHLQYRSGTLNYIDVLDAQRRYFEAQIGVSNAVRDEYLALVNLYKALGGGWRVKTSDSQTK